MSTAVKINQYDLPSRNAFCLALAIIAAIAIFVNIHTRTAYVSAEAQVMVSQPLVEKDSFHMTPSKKRCTLQGPMVSHGQGNEDISVYKRYFASPPRCNGTFLELGALNGKSLSNTLFFEENLGWSGVLIKAHPDNAARLMVNRKHTKNFAMAVCEEGQESIEIVGSGAMGGIQTHMTEKHIQRIDRNKTYVVPCAPLARILHQAGVEQIDFVSLDVEWAELAVLRTMDWDIPVLVWLIEVGHGDDEEIKELMTQHGYGLSTWNIRDECEQRHCPNNIVFENLHTTLQ